MLYTDINVSSKRYIDAHLYLMIHTNSNGAGGGMKSLSSESAKSSDSLDISISSL